VRTYVLRRLLLMIPMLFGISIVNFLIINAGEAPRMSNVNESGDFDASASMQANEREHIFRRTFNLDKPRFYNTRYGLRDEEIAWLLASPQRAWEIPADRKDAMHTLDDYGRVIVPHLLRIADTALRDRAMLDRQLRPDYVQRWRKIRSRWLAEGRPPGDIEWPPPEEPPSFDEAFRARLATITLARLANNAPRRPEVIYGEIPPDVRERNQEVRKEQARLRRIFRDPRTTELEKLGLWQAWADEHAAEWEYSTGDKVEMFLLETRFAKFWANLLSFDLGTSFTHRKKVWALIGERIHVSLTLSLGSLLLAYLISIPLGILSAATHRTKSDAVITILLFVAYSMPVMFLCVLLVQYLAIGRGWFPVAAFHGTEYEGMTVVGKLRDVAWHVALPLIAMTIPYLAIYSRYMKSGLIEIIHADYIRTARAKGVHEFVVVMKHAVRNGLIPIITLIGSSLPVVLAGSVVVEFIFQIEGMGKLAFDSVTNRDYAVLMGLNILTAALTLVGVFLADLAYAFADPRISYR
jgi:peptide/nickel transport system permease protein